MSYFSSDKFNRIKEWDLAFPTVENQGGVRTWQKFLVKCLTTIMIDEKESAIILLTQDYHLQKSQHLNIEPFTRSQNTHTVTKLEEEGDDLSRWSHYTHKHTFVLLTNAHTHTQATSFTFFIKSGCGHTEAGKAA